jgi:hypothetical protein
LVKFVVGLFAVEESLGSPSADKARPVASLPDLYYSLRLSRLSLLFQNPLLWFEKYFWRCS